MGVFSSRPKASAGHHITETDRAVLALKTQKRKLVDYQKRTEASVEREQQAVRSWVAAGDKQRALLALKKKKIQEDALQKASDWVLRIEQQLVDLESASRQAQVVESLRVGQAAMAALQKELKLDDVEELMQSTEDSKAHLQEVQAILDSHLSPEAEDAVLKELEELERELGMLKDPSVQAASGEATLEAARTGPPLDKGAAEGMPTVPSHKINRAEEGEEGHRLPFPSVPSHKVVVAPDTAEEEEVVPRRERRESAQKIALEG